MIFLVLSISKLIGFLLATLAFNHSILIDSNRLLRDVTKNGIAENSIKVNKLKYHSHHQHIDYSPHCFSVQFRFRLFELLQLYLEKLIHYFASRHLLERYLKNLFSFSSSWKSFSLAAWHSVHSCFFGWHALLFAFSSSLGGCCQHFFLQ